MKPKIIISSVYIRNSNLKTKGTDIDPDVPKIIVIAKLSDSIDN